MRSLQNSKPLTISLLVAAGLLILHIGFRIPSGEGFNPSDEGVVLAQSWRILKGEIPHHDFISLRPAGSGFFHLIDFVLPGPLIIVSKWLTLIEYLIYSITISLLLINLLFRDTRPAFRNRLVAGSVILSALLNVNHYNLFAWTTIDALFWFSVALYGYYRYQGKENSNNLWIFVAVATSIISALCRQTFALPAAVLMILLLIRILREMKPRTLVAYVAGLTPGIAYLLMLLVTGSFREFLVQMTGRTELWETGFVRFFNAFWHSPAVWIMIPVIVTLLCKRWYQETGKKTGRIESIIITQKYVIIIGIILGSILVFIMPERLFGMALLMLWLTVAALVLVLAGEGHVAGKEIILWVLLLAWTSSISAGDNAPVFATGLLAVSALLLLIRHLPTLKAYRTPVYLTGFLLVVLLGLYVKAQKENNYRDLPTARLTIAGGTLFRDLAGVRVNPELASYLQDIRRIYHDCGSPAGRFAVWPNNAIVYRFLESRNPFPLDWMQQPEFAGSEERLMKQVEELLNGQELFILVEKFNVKWIAGEKVPLNPGSGDYPYLDILRRMYREVPSGSEWFSLYVRK